MSTLLDADSARARVACVDDAGEAIDALERFYLDRARPDSPP